MSEARQDSPGRLRERAREGLAERAAKGRLRELRVAAPVRVNLADNDYLGLSQDVTVKAAVRTALENGAVSAASSPLVRGYTEIHAKLEKTLCAWHGFGCGLVWNTGFVANQAVLGTLAAPGDVILADRLVHHSLIAGILKSRAKFHRFAHNDLPALEELLKENRADKRVVWVITESIYSMDGDGPDLAALAELKKRYGFVWMLDEAHALGWYGTQGQGRASDAKVVKDVDVFIGTFGKALGGMGAYSLFHEPALRETLINQSGEFIYSTYLSPLLAAAANAAIARVKELSSESAKWRALSRKFRKMLREHGFDAPEGDSPIVPVVIGADDAVIALGKRLRVRGFAVGAIRPPTVPEGGARLRISLKSSTAWSDLEALANELCAWRDEPARGKTAKK